MILMWRTSLYQQTDECMLQHLLFPLENLRGLRTNIMLAHYSTDATDWSVLTDY